MSEQGKGAKEELGAWTLSIILFTIVGALSFVFVWISVAPVLFGTSVKADLGLATPLFGLAGSIVGYYTGRNLEANKSKKCPHCGKSF